MNLFLWMAPIALAAVEPRFAFRELGGGRLELSENGAPVFVYNHGPQLPDGVPADRRRSSYLHPVWSPGGVVLTDDFPKDHYHHRGVFWAWPVVKLGADRYDLWTLRGAGHSFVKWLEREATAEKATLAVENHWTVAGKPVLRETVRITVHPARDGAREFDFRLTLDALAAIEIAGSPDQNKGYGGLSCRFAPRTGTTIRTSDGILPGDEDHGAHAWAGMEAEFGGRRAGLRITADSLNPGYPNVWCLRQYGFIGASFPGTRSFRLSPGQPVTLRYNVSVWDAARDSWAQAEDNGRRFDKAAAAMDRTMRAWLQVADARTGLIPERLPGGRGMRPGERTRRYTAHNTGADLYPYLILCAELTDPALYRGRMLEMLRNEIRYTTVVDSLPGDLDLDTGKLGPLNLFGAAEYAKDGLLAVTELLGRTPWFYRMKDITADIMKHAPVATRWGNLPGADAEINGDVLQVLARLIPMTGDPRYLEWARRIADAYLEEVLPGCHDLPCMRWDFAAHRGDNRVQLRDHGNETVVGLALLFALEMEGRTERARRYRPVLARMFDRILASANPDGMFYDAIDPATLKPVRERLSDNWGYLYGAMYTFYQVTGETKYRDAVRHVLAGLPKYRNYDWENGSFDGIADSVESAVYLYNREPAPAAAAWLDSETDALLARQEPSGFLERWYGEGNFIRTVYLYALWKSQGCRPAEWRPGVELGAVREGERLLLSLKKDAVVRFDFARHRSVLQYAKNYVRLNEFPEWYTVEENRLYRLRKEDAGQVFLGSELIAGVALSAGRWTAEPLR
ncbi:MAG: PmoA family protein [Acidobacteria bacterium]|nr:PmoA family protein [Acidobacteriota bacterium]